MAKTCPLSGPGRRLGLRSLRSNKENQMGRLKKAAKLKSKKKNNKRKSSSRMKRNTGR